MNAEGLHTKAVPPLSFLTGGITRVLLSGLEDRRTSSFRIPMDTYPQPTLNTNTNLDFSLLDDLNAAGTSPEGDLALGWYHGMASEDLQNGDSTREYVSRGVFLVCAVGLHVLQVFDKTSISRPSYHLAKYNPTTERPPKDLRLACPDYKSAVRKQIEPECNNIAARSIGEVFNHLNSPKGRHRRSVEDCGNCHEVFLTKEAAASHKNGSSTCPESKFITTAPGATVARWKAIYCMLTESDDDIPSPCR